MLTKSSAHNNTFSQYFYDCLFSYKGKNIVNMSVVQSPFLNFKIVILFNGNREVSGSALCAFRQRGSVQGWARVLSMGSVGTEKRSACPIGSCRGVSPDKEQEVRGDSSQSAPDNTNVPINTGHAMAQYQLESR